MWDDLKAPGSSGGQPPNGGPPIGLSLPPPEPEPPPQPSRRSALLLTGQVIFRGPDHGTLVAGGRPLAVPLQTDDQPYQRHIEVGPAWQSLDCGWLESGASLLILENRGAGTRQTVPTAEDAADAAARIVELGTDPPRPPEPPRDMHSPDKVAPPGPAAFTAVLPGGAPAQLPNPNLDDLRIRSRHGTAKCVLTLFPL